MKKTNGTWYRAPVLVLAVAVAAIMALAANAQDRPMPQLKPLAAGSLHDRVTALDKLFNDPKARFSASKAMADLQVLRAEAAPRPDAAVDLRKILFMMALIEIKRHDLAQAQDFLAKAMALPAGDARDYDVEMHRHHDIAALAEQGGDYATAADYYGQAAALAERVAGLSQSQRLGIRVQQAFVLHEGGQLQAALDLNRAVLADAERLFGADTYDFRAVLTNIAQNLHALGRGAEAEPFLQRCLAVVRAHGDIEREQDMLFQLGVLAFELGRPQEAQMLLRERVTLLRTHKDTARLAVALQDLAHLERQLK